MFEVREVLKYYPYRTARIRNPINVLFDCRFHNWIAEFAGRSMADNHELYVVRTGDRKVAIWFHDSTIAIGNPEDVVVGDYGG